MQRKIALVTQQKNLKTDRQNLEDQAYWLSKSPQERLAAVTFLVNQNLRPFQRMDKSAVSTRSLKP